MGKNIITAACALVITCLSSCSTATNRKADQAEDDAAWAWATPGDAFPSEGARKIKWYPVRPERLSRAVQLLESRTHAELSSAEAQNFMDSVLESPGGQRPYLVRCVSSREHPCTGATAELSGNHLYVEAVVWSFPFIRSPVIVFLDQEPIVTLTVWGVVKTDFSPGEILIPPDIPETR